MLKNDLKLNQNHRIIFRDNKDMTTYKSLSENKIDLLALTGLMLEEFNILLPNFKQAYDETYPIHFTKTGALRQRIKKVFLKESLAELEDKLLFILAYEKTNCHQTLFGELFNLSQPRISALVHELTPILKLALEKMKHLPVRNALDLSNELNQDKTERDIIVDGMERDRSRPVDATKQTENYSGKNKCHTDKNIVISDPIDTRVLYLSPTYSGKTHDKAMLDKCELIIPSHIGVYKDTGFQGYEPIDVQTCQPKKKTKNYKLDSEDKTINQYISKIRVTVEHTICGIKRSRVIKDICRCWQDDFRDLLTLIACGLHNLRVSARFAI